MSSETPQMNLSSNWTEQEKWVWEKLSKGETADFTTEEAKGKLNIETKVSQECSEKTVISPVFLRTVLLDEAYRGVLPGFGVRIIGAWVKEPLSLEEVILGHPWWMDKCLFEAEVLLRCLRTPWLISLESSIFKRTLIIDGGIYEDSLNIKDSIFNGDLNLNSVEIKKHLLMNGESRFSTVTLDSTKIGGHLVTTNSTFMGLLTISTLDVGHHLFMNNAQFAEINLGSSQVGGQLEMIGSTFKGPLCMSSLDIKQSLLMNKSQFDEINLGGIKVGGQLEMIGSNFNGPLNMTGSIFEGSLNITDSTFRDLLNMNSLEVKQSLIMNKSRFAEVKLGGIKGGGRWR